MELEQEHPKHNGPDRTFVRQLQSIVGKVRFGWAVAMSALSPIFLIAALLIHNGWIEVPAKDADLKVVQAKLVNVETSVAAQAEALRVLNIASIRLEEAGKSQQRTLDNIDGKLTSIEGQHLAIMRAFVTPPPEQKASTAPAPPPPSPSQRPRARAPKKQESGLRLW